MQFDYQGRHYHMIRASDLKRAGIRYGVAFRQLCCCRGFLFRCHHDVTREFTISVFEQALPLEVIEQLIKSARIGLLAAEKIHGL
jgi:hypothetical protein